MKNIHYIISLSFVLGFFISSCQDDTQEIFSMAEPQLPKEDFAAYTGETIQVEFDASLPEANVNITRALKEDTEDKLHMDYSNWTGSVNVHIALRKKNAPAEPITYKTVQGSISSSGSGYTLKIEPASLQLKEGLFDGVSWEVCAMIDKRNSIVLDRQYQSREFNTMTYLDAESNFNLKNLEIPIYSSYTDVIVNGRNKTLPLRFKPLGCVITATLENNLYTDINYTGVNIQEANVIAGELLLDFGKEIAETKIPEVRRKNGSKTKRCMFDFTTTLKTPNNITKKVYLWCLPVRREQVTKPRFGMFFKVGNNEAKPDSIVYKSQETLSFGFETGMNYRIALHMPESDLMITEFGHLNPGGENYSWIELFNPTSHDINLWEYGLARVHKWDPDPADPTKAVWQSKMIGWHDPCPLGQATIQNLHITEESNPIYNGDGSIYSSPSAANRFEPMFMNHTTLQKYKLQSGNILKPGKTIVLFAGGTRNLIAERESLDNDYWPHNKSGFESYYLANAVAEGKCQYVIAVDNGIRENAYAGMGDWKSDQGGTLQHAAKNSIVLVKRTSPGSGPYRIIDAVAGTVNSDLFNSFLTRLPARMTSSNDWWWAGRSENTMFPMGLREPEDVQHGTPFNADSPWADTAPFGFMDWTLFLAKWTWYKHLMSPGTRSYDNTTNNDGKKMPGALNVYNN